MARWSLSTAFMLIVGILCGGIGRVSDAAEPTGAAADSGGEQPRMVIVEGVGADVENARRDAYRQAVRQVLGAIVDSQTLVENDQLITDKVVVFSDGFIERVEPLPEGEAREQSGLVRLRMKAFVKTGQLAESLRSNAIAVAATEVAIDDADSLLARVTTTRERAEEARELFLAAAKTFPADCLQVEAYPLTDANVRVQDDVVWCDVRIKVSARHREYEEFARRLITFLETLQPEVRQTIRLPAPTAIMRKKGFNATLESHIEGLKIDARLLFPGTRVAEAFDRVGHNPLLNFGARSFLWSDSKSHQEFHDKITFCGLERRTGRHGFSLSVIPTATAPYDVECFFLDSQKMAWFGGMHGGVRCDIEFCRDGESVAKASTQLRNFGVAVESRFADLPDWNKAVANRLEPLGEAVILPGYGTPFSFGPACEITVPVRVPAAEFTKGLRLRCTLANRAEAGP